MLEQTISFFKSDLVYDLKYLFNHNYIKNISVGFWQSRFLNTTQVDQICTYEYDASFISIISYYLFIKMKWFGIFGLLAH